MTTMLPRNQKQREVGMNPLPLDFARLDDQRFEVTSGRDFESVAELMNARFSGLPSFHRSVRLDLLEDSKLISGEEGQLSIPKELDRLVEKHLRADLEHLISFINRGDGIKSLGILRLNIGLNDRFAREHLEREVGQKNPLIRAATRFVSTHVRVPIVLAVASRRNGNHYESLAVGVRGVTRYSSALVVRPRKEKGSFDIVGGLEAEVRPENIDHPISRLLVAFGDSLLPTGFFNNYLNRYMVPERQRIVSKLCHYVFSGLRSTSGGHSRCTVTPLVAPWVAAAAS